MLGGIIFIKANTKCQSSNAKEKPKSKYPNVVGSYIEVLGFHLTLGFGHLKLVENHKGIEFVLMNSQAGQVIKR